MRLAVLLTLAMAVPALAQKGSVDVKGSLGWTGFVDESSQNHLLVAGSVRYYLTRKLSVEPELQYLRLSDRHHDWVFLPSVNYDLRSGRVAPYLTVGFGAIRTTERFFNDFNDTQGFLSGGAGVKAYLNDRFFVAPEFRIGTELHARFSVGLGYSWGR